MSFVLRSLLFVPADSERKIARAMASEADVVILDLEDSVALPQKEEARLRDDAYQEQMARAILIGIKRYFAKNPPLARNPLT